MPGNPSLYDRIGGTLAVRAVVFRLYRHILNDPELAEFFRNIDVERLQRSQIAFVTYAFGGPRLFNGDLRAAHRPSVARGLGDRHFDLVAGHLGRAMAETGMSQMLIDEALATVATVRDEILDR